MIQRMFYAMRLSSYILFLSIFCCNTLIVEAQGLQFRGNEYIIDDRTSYNVFQNIHPTFSDSLTISFDLSAEHNPNSGYILRIKTQDPSLTFNLSYDSQSDYTIYTLNEEGKSTLLTIKTKKEQTQSGAWYPLKFKFDLTNQLVYFSMDHIVKSCKIKLPKTLQPQIHFGRSEYFIDLPNFAIRNLQIKDGTQEYKFPFNQNRGSRIADEMGQSIGTVINPVWLINRNYYWKQRAAFKSTNTAGFNFDNINNKVYYFDKDSITTYDIVNKKEQKQAYTNNLPVHLILGYNFLDIPNAQLFSYEITPTLDKEASIAKLDLATNTWTAVSDHTFPKRLHHHGKFYDATNHRFIIFGGFGNKHYNNEFNSYDLSTNTWSKLTFTGDVIFPRYFLSMGYKADENALYVFGGMGNESGEYNVGRKYYYDCYKVDLNKMHISKLWEIPWQNDYVVPVKSMLIDNEHFMTLCYPEHRSNTYLKLYKFAIADGSYQVFGDSIPIRSEKITTNADIFANNNFSEIYGVIQEFEDDDIASSLKIYSLSTPVLSYDELFPTTHVEASSSKTYWLAALLISCFGVGIGTIIIRKRKKQSVRNTENLSLENEVSITDKSKLEPLKKNAIFLFGDFAVYDKIGRNIGYMFSARLKQTFILILQNSLDKGITTQQLTALLWWDRDDSKAKNIRGVTINELRKILDELDGISLVYENSCYKIIFEENIFCDYTKCLEAISNDNQDINFSLFSHIITRGKFLKDENDSIYDSIKTSLEQKMEPLLTQLIKENYKTNNLKTVVSLCEAMLNIDPVCDIAILYLVNALDRLKNGTEARKKFLQFLIEYKEIMGEEYPKDYTTILRENI